MEAFFNKLEKMIIPTHCNFETPSRRHASRSWI